MPISSKEPSSNKKWMRSRAVNFPLACCDSMRFSPPPNWASAFLASNISNFVSCQIFTLPPLKP